MRRIVWAGIALVVVAGIVAAAWVWRDDIAGAARQIEVNEQLRQALRESEQEAQRERERRKQIAETAEERLERLDALRERQEELQEVIEDDESAADWAGRPLPNGVVRLLRDGAGDAHGDGNGDAAGRVDEMPEGKAEADGD